MNTVMTVAQEIIQKWPRLDMDNAAQELEIHAWPIVDTLDWENACDIFTFSAALYYAETALENVPAEQMSGGLYNEFLSAVQAERFPKFTLKNYAVISRINTVLKNPLSKEIDPFWLLFPNNLNLQIWNTDDIAALMLLSAYSKTILNYRPFGSLLYIHGHPKLWVSLNSMEPHQQAQRGFDYLKKDLQQEGLVAYTRGTFV